LHPPRPCISLFFFFQAEDGIRDRNVTGVQTCALPISNFAAGAGPFSVAVGDFNGDSLSDLAVANASGGSISILLGDGSGSFTGQIGRASCRERGERWVVGVGVKERLKGDEMYICE